MSKKIPYIHFENLDALRFFAAFSVIIFHLVADLKGEIPAIEVSAAGKVIAIIADKGKLGVNFFFVLSGFLITYLIFHEHKYTGDFSLKNFLIRRTLRIWPLYYLVVILGFLVFPYVLEGYETVHSPILFVFFLANFSEIYSLGADPYNFLTVLWSVSIEEQFYLFWSIFLFLFFSARYKLLWPALLVITIVSLYFRASRMDQEMLIYYHTLSVCQDIITGAFIGWSLFTGKRWLEQLRGLKKHWVILIYLGGIVLCIVKNKVFAGGLVTVERLVLSAFFGFVILDQIRGEHSFFKFGRLRLLNYLGKISYGLYMYHLLVMFFLWKWIRTQGWDGWTMILIYVPVAILLTVGVSSISYRFYERPFLRMKPK